MPANMLGLTVSNGFEAIVAPADDGYSVDSIEMIDNTVFESKARMYREKIERIKNGEGFLSPEELNKKLKSQPLTIITSHFKQKTPEDYLATGNMIGAVLQNNSDETILNCTVAFACWDENNLPLKIYRPYSTYNASFIMTGDYTNINLQPKQKFG